MAFYKDIIKKSGSSISNMEKPGRSRSEANPDI
jgi:hypothetical protein